MIRVADFGAIPDAQIVNGQVIGTDNTASIQLAINAAQGDSLQFERGIYKHGALDITNRQPIIFRGAGPGYSGTLLLPCTDGIGLDFTGTPASGIRDMRIGDRANPFRPTAAVVHAPSSTVAGIDCLQYDNVQITGRYSVSAFYAYGICSSSFKDLRIWKFDQDPGTFACTISRDNINSVQSAFAVMGEPTTCSNLRWIGECEWHDYSSNAQGYALRLRGVENSSFEGNVTGSYRLIRTEAPQGVSPVRIKFNCTFQGEQGTNPPLPDYIFEFVSDLTQADFGGTCKFGYGVGFKTGQGNMQAVGVYPN